MRRILLAALGLLFSGTVAAAEFRDLTATFTATWDATQQLPEPQRVAAMKQALMAQYPEFYGRGEAAQQDARISRAIKRFPAIRAAYLEQAQRFSAAMQQHLQTFNAVFPDFRLTVPTELVHSLGEMNGGTRELNGKTHLIFGADMIAALDPKGDAAPLFHHELFHVLHQQHFTCSEDIVWSHMWIEGLATYVSAVMNPQANEKELLLDYPAGMASATRAQLPDAWAQLNTVLDSADEKVNEDLFSMGDKTDKLPPRRAYYLGYLIAKDAAKTHDLPALAKLDCKQVRALVGATVARFAKESAQ